MSATTINQLKLTYKELHDITYENIDRFEVLYNDIPKDGHSSQYIEDDGRQMRYFEFKDKETGIEYNFSYIYHSEWDYEFPLSFLSTPTGIDFVNDSVINPKVIIKEVEVKKKLSEKEIIDEELVIKYNAVDTKKMNESEIKKLVPSIIIKDLINFLKSNEKFTLLDLRAKILPVCTEFGIDMNSFWSFIQKKRGAWK